MLGFQIIPQPISAQLTINQWVPVNCFNQLITHARSQDLGFRTWISGPGFQALNARFQDLESSPSYGRLIFFPSLFSASSGHRQTHGRPNKHHSGRLRFNSPAEPVLPQKMQAGSAGELKCRGRIQLLSVATVRPASRAAGFRR